MSETRADLAGPREALWLRELVLGLKTINPDDLFGGLQKIALVEKEMESSKPQRLGVGLFGRKISFAYDQRWGKEFMDDYWKVFAAAAFALYRRRLYQIGLLTLKRKGDLRSACVEGNAIRVICAMLRFEWTRNNRQAWIQSVLKMRTSPKDRRAIQAALKSDPWHFAHLMKQSPLENFLCRYWVTGAPSIGKTRWPPLCYYTDAGLAELCQWWARFSKESPPDSSTLRSIWEHLGLRRSEFATLATIERSARSGNPLIISERPRSQKPIIPQTSPSEPPFYPSIPLPEFLL